MNKDLNNSMVLGIVLPLVVLTVDYYSYAFYLNVTGHETLGLILGASPTTCLFITVLVLRKGSK